MKARITALAAIVSILSAFAPAYGQAADGQSLAARIERVTTGLAGRIGFAAQEIGSEDVIALNGDESFAMASTYKVAIATTVLDRVDKGELTLDQMVDITPDMMIAGDNAIAETYVHPGMQLSVANVIEVMITYSDNTAADTCIRLAGGPAAVTKKLRGLGIEDQRVDRPTAELIRDFYDLPGLATVEVMAEVVRTDPQKAARAADPSPDFEHDPRDHTTPLAMLQLLRAIDDGTALSPESREFLLGAMSRTQTGVGRLRGMLPRGTPVAHKTGTIGGVANDVGFITLPDGRRFAIAVFTNSSATPEADRDRAIAEVARSLFDYFYFAK